MKEIIIKNVQRLKLLFPFLVIHSSPYRFLFDICTHMTKKERLLLYKLAKGLPYKSKIVEIGSYLGASSAFLALGATKNNSSVYCVDTWENDAMSEEKRDTFEDFLKNTAPVKDYIIPLRGKSFDVAKSYSDEIALLFIDGDHSYEGCKSDIQAWLPKVKENGLVIFHDYNWAEGVSRAVNEDIKPIQDRYGKVDSIYWAKIRRVTDQNGAK